MAMEPIKFPQIRPTQLPGVGGTAPLTLDFNSYEFQRRIRQRVGELQLERQQKLDMRSLWDVIFNTEGRKEAVNYFNDLTGWDISENNWVAKNVFSKLKLADNLFFGIPTKVIKTFRGDMRLTDIDIGQELGTNLMNWLYFVGDTLDFLSFFIKSGIIAHQEGMSYAEALKMSFGFRTEDGRHRMDFQRIAENSNWWGDGFVPVMVGEMITDPLLVFALAKAAASGATKAVAAMAKQSDELLEHAVIRRFSPIVKEYLTKTVIESADDMTDAAVKAKIKTAHRLNEAIKYGDEDAFRLILSRQRDLSDDLVKELGGAFAENSAKYKASAAMRFLTAADNVENKLIQTIGKSNPMIATTRLGYRGAKYLRWGRYNIDEIVTFFTKNTDFTVSEFEAMSKSDLQRKIKLLEEHIQEGFMNKTLGEEEAAMLNEQLRKGYFWLHKKETADIMKKARNQQKTLNDKLASLRKQKEQLFKDYNLHDADLYEKSYRRLENAKAGLSRINRKIKARQDVLESLNQQILKKQQDALARYDRAFKEFELAQKQLNEATMTAEQIKSWSPSQFEYNIEQLTASRRRLDRAIKELDEAQKMQQHKTFDLATDEEMVKLQEEYKAKWQQHSKLEKEFNTLDARVKENPEQFSKEQIELYKLNRQLKRYESELMDVNDAIAAQKGHWERLKKIETLARTVDYDEMSKQNWSKYARKEEYDKLLKEIKELSIKRSDAIATMNKIIGNKDKYQAARKVVKELNDKLHMAETKRNIVEDIKYLLNHAERGTKYAEGISHFVNKTGNEALRTLLRRFAKEDIAAYEQLLKNRKPFLDDALKNLEGQLEPDKIELHKAMQEEVQEYMERINRMRGMLGNEIIEDPTAYREITQIYTRLRAKLNKDILSKYEEYRVLAYEITQKFERWFDEDYAKNLTALEDRVKEANQKVKHFESEKYYNEKQLEIWKKELDDATTEWENYKEELPMIDPEDVMKALDLAIKNYVDDINPTLAKSFRSLQKIFDLELMNIIQRSGKKAKRADVLNEFTGHLKAKADAVIKARALALGAHTPKTITQFTENMTTLIGSLKGLSRGKLRARVGEPGNELWTKIMHMRKDMREMTDEGLAKLLADIKADPEKTLLYVYLKELRDQPFLLDKMEQNPRLLLNYINNIHQGKLMAIQIANLTYMQDVLRVQAKSKFKELIRFTEDGHMKLVNNMYSSEEKLLVDTYNTVTNFRQIANQVTRDNVPVALLGQYKRIEHTIEAFRKTRAEEHVLAMEAITHSNFGMKQIEAVLSRAPFHLVNVGEAQLYGLKAYMTTYMKESAIYLFKKTFSEMVSGDDYGVIFSVYKRLEVMKRFKVPSLSRAIKGFNQGLVLPMMRRQGDTVAMQKYFSEAYLKRVADAKLPDAPKLTTKQMAQAEVRLRIQEIEKYLEMTYEAVEDPYIRPVREAFNSLLPTGTEKVQQPSIFHSFVAANNNVFKASPLDVFGATGKTNLKVFRRGDGTEFEGSIDIQNGKIMIDGNEAHPIVVDAETQGMRNDFNQFGERIQEAFQYSIKDTRTGENKVYWIMVDGGKLTEKTSKYTGITNNLYQELIANGKVLPNKEALQAAIQRDFPNANLFIAHNAGFDLKYMPDAMRQQMIVMDSLPLLRLIYHEKYSRFGLEHLVKGEFKGGAYEQLTVNIRARVARSMDTKQQLDQINFHNANFDTEALYELIFRADRKGNLLLENLMKERGIKNLNELNDLTSMLFSGESKKILDKIHDELFDMVYAFEKSAIEDLDLTFAEQNLLGKTEALHLLLRDLPKLLKDPKAEVHTLVNALMDIEDRVQDARRVIDRVNSSGAYEESLNQLPQEIIDYVENVEQIVVMLNSAFESAASRQASILDAFYGNATGSLIKSRFYAHSMILSYLGEGRPLRRLTNIFSNTKGVAEDTLELELRTKTAFLKADMVNRQRVLEGLPPIEGMDPVRVQQEFAKRFPDHPLVKLNNFLEEINEYEDVQNQVFRMIRDSELFASLPEEQQHLAFHSMYDLMYQMDKAFFRKLENGEEVTLNELRLIYNRLALQTGANKFVQQMTALDTKAFNIVDRDALEFFWKYVVKRYDMIEKGSETTRLMLNPDTGLTNDMYYKLKDFFTDIIHTIDSSTKTEIVRNVETTKVENILTSRDVGAIAANYNDYFEHIIDDLRKPLRAIKEFNRQNELQPIHIGQMREFWYKEVNSKNANANFKYWTSADVIDETALPIAGAENVLKLSKATKDVYRIKRGIYDIFEGLTPKRKTLKEVGDKIQEIGEGAWFKDTSFQETALYKIFDDFMGILDYEGSVFDLVKYAKSNQVKSHYRMIKVERLNNLIEISRLDKQKNPVFEAVRKAWREMQEWVDHPFTTYLKNDELHVDSLALQEFEYRFKATLYDFLMNTESTKLTAEMNKGFTMAEILEEGSKRARQMTIKDIQFSQTKILSDARPHFEDSYQRMRTLFFREDEAGIQQFIDFANKNNLTLAYQVQGKNSVKLKKFNKLTPELVREFDNLYRLSHGNPVPNSTLNHIAWDLGAKERPLTFGVVDQHQFMTLQKILRDTHKFPDGSWQAVLRRALLAPLKVISLFSANFTLGNAIDITLKNVKETEGGMMMSYTMFYNTYRAMKMHTTYSKLYDEAVKVLDFGTYDNFGSEWVDAYRRRLMLEGPLSDAMKRDLDVAEIVNEFVRTEAAASEMNQMLLRMRRNVIGKGHQEDAWQFLMNKVFFSKWGTDSSLNFNPFSANLQFNGWLETVGRLGMHLDNVSKGLSKDESLNKILRTHFNYSSKSQAEMYGEFIVPFISYPLRSFEYWSEALFEKGVETRVLFKALETAWGDALDDNSYAQYQMSRGNIPVGNTALQTGFTFMDAMQMSNVSGEYGPLPDQLVRKMNPLIKNLALPAAGKLDWQTGMERMPVVSQGAKMLNIPTAFQSEDVTQMFPSIVDPYYRGSFNSTRRSFMYRNPYLSKPTDSNSVTFRMFGKYKYGPMNRLKYRWTDIQKFYRP